MFAKLTDPIFRLRSVALIEGFSFLLLLFVSMPLKYYMGMRGFSFYVGALHGALFVIYIFIAFKFKKIILKLYQFGILCFGHF
jgi:integral membrane protein